MGLALWRLGYSPTEYARYQVMVNAVIKETPVTGASHVTLLLQNRIVWETLSVLLSQLPHSDLTDTKVTKVIKKKVRETEQRIKGLHPAVWTSLDGYCKEG